MGGLGLYEGADLPVSVFPLFKQLRFVHSTLLREVTTFFSISSPSFSAVPSYTHYNAHSPAISSSLVELPAFSHPTIQPGLRVAYSRSAKRFTRNTH